MKGKKFECTSCGAVAVFDTDCSCGAECDVVCCGKPMIPRGYAEEFR